MPFMALLWVILNDYNTDTYEVVFYSRRVISQIISFLRIDFTSIKFNNFD